MYIGLSLKKWCHARYCRYSRHTDVVCATSKTGEKSAVRFYRATQLCQGSLSYRNYSVNLSVCLSVRLSHACFVTKPNNALRIFWYHTKGQSLLAFWHQQWLVGDDAPSIWNMRSKLSTPFKKRQLRQISAYNGSTVRDSKKIQLQRIGSRPRAFQRAIDGVHTLPLSPPKGWLKKAIFVLLNKIQFQSNKVCHKVSLCENFRGNVVV